MKKSENPDLIAASSDAVAVFSRSAPSCALTFVDLIANTFPDIDGLVVLETLRERCPTIPVVMISAFDDPELIRSALDSGAAGFVPKSSRSAVILGAVRLVLAGDIYVPRRALDAPAAPSEPAQAPPETRRRQRCLAARVAAAHHHHIEVQPHLSGSRPERRLLQKKGTGYFSPKKK